MENFEEKDKSPMDMKEEQEEKVEEKEVKETNEVDEDADSHITLNQYRKFMSLLSYFAFLVLIPLICMSKDKVVKRHASNGLALLIIELSLYVLATIFSSISAVVVIIIYVLLLFPLIFTIIGIVCVAQDMHKEVPLIGKMKILK